jgi:hypothetical protein
MDTIKWVLDTAGIPYRSRGSSGRAAIFIGNGSIIEFRSWDKSKNLGGRAVHFMVVDEAGQLTKDARTRLEARLSGTLGPIHYIGNAELTGSEFWKICQDAVEAEAEPELNVAGGRPRIAFKQWTWRDRYKALRIHDPEGATEYKAWIEQKYRENPDEAKRLYGAEWAIPERAILASVVPFLFGEADGMTPLAPSTDPHPGHTYMTGWDIGIEHDWTVGVPLCLDCWTITDMDRFRPGDSTGMEDRIIAYARHWNNAAAVIETNGPGKPVFDRVVSGYKGGSVQRWFTDNKNKRAAVWELIEHAKGEVPLRIALSPRMRVMMGEMQVFQSLQNPKTGTWTFQAPAGTKDDTVMGALVTIGAATSGAQAYIELMKRIVARRREEREKAAAA